MWNEQDDPISKRLRDEDQILKVIKNKTMMYNPKTDERALVMEVYIVDHPDDATDTGYSMEEDRWVEYTTESGPKEDFSVDLDEDGWLWHDELEVKI